MLLIAVSAPPVFSAYAEVVPWILANPSYGFSILRVRGGSSPCYCSPLCRQAYSPRTRR